MKHILLLMWALAVFAAYAIIYVFPKLSAVLR